MIGGRLVRTYTISEAAQVTGVSRKAIARRVERGSLQSVLRNGRRRIPRSELVRAGLVPEGDAVPAGGTAAAPAHPVGQSQNGADSADVFAALVRELLDRLERQSAETAELRALTTQAESLRYAAELAELRARIAELELERGSGGGAALPPPAGDDVREGAAEAVSEVRSQFEPELARLRWRLAELETTRRPRHVLPHAARLAGEAILILAVALGAWLAELEAPAVVGAVALAWLIAASIEWIGWRQRR
jgi:excisionase family DNA binding protein